MAFRILIIIIVCVLSIVANVSAQEGCPWLEKMLKGLPHKYTVEQSDNLSFGKEQAIYAESLQKAKAYRAKSKLPYSVDSTGNKYLRFTVRHYEFESDKSAQAAKRHFAASAHADMGHTYSWDIVLSKANSLYWLNADCLYSSKSFEVLVENLISAIYDNGKSTVADSVRCVCGAGCKG